MSQTVTSLLWFVAIVAFIPLLLWLMKHSPLMGPMSGRFSGRSSGSSGLPRTVATLALSAQQKIITVEVGHGDSRQWLVLGVSPQGIRTLHTMLAQDEPDTGTDALHSTPPPAAFAQLLGRLRGSKSKGDDRDAF
jgi:flagellar protein FliO/FliZ